MSDELIYLSAAELLRRYREKSLSPVEAVAAVLTQIDRHNGTINAFNVLDQDWALAQARASEARWVAGEPQGRLDGVPVSIKDLMLTKGYPTLRGSRTVDPAGPWEDDTSCVARLKEHGAVIVGKTTTPEFGWKGITDSALTGITRNPWDLSKTPGGSSGGASAALAAGMAPLAMGSDGGGSIRIPSGFTGVFGLKANFGRVPQWPASPMGTLSHHGPMTRSVYDAALAMNVIAEPDSRDWMSLPYQAIDFTSGLEGGVAGMKVAFSPTLGYAKVDAEIAEAVAAAATVFADLGAEIDEVDPGFSDPAEAFNTHWWAGAASALGGLPADKKALLEPELAEVVEQGSRITIAQYTKAVSARVQLGEHMRAFHQRYDLLLTPALAVPAFEVGRLYPEGRETSGFWLDWTPFSYPFNMTQQPACSIPCGFTGAGLPVGLQIVAANYREDLVLKGAYAYEQANPITRRPRL